MATQKTSGRARPPLLIGTSGWHYTHWIGNFYPAQIRKEDWLPSYAHTFKTVEINRSFYRLPTPEAARAWHDASPPGFLFSVKASRFLTHMKKLKDAREPLNRLIRWADGLKDKLGPILFQLPPHFKVNIKRLEDFLKLLPRGHAYALEFRDASWFCEPVYKRLEKKGVSLCLYNLQGRESPLVLTAPFIYLRFHGPDPRKYSGSYPAGVLKTWSRRLQGWLDAGRKAYVYFNNDLAGHAPKNALELDRLVR